MTIVRFKFDKNKAIPVALYVSTKLVGVDFHKFFKILYFADQKHLTNYGRPILGGNYIAMKDGPVHSQVYDILKSVKDDFIFNVDDYKEFFEVKDGFHIYPKSTPDLDRLSESEVECLEESIKENKNLPFKKLRVKSHDLAYENANKNDVISILNVAKAGGAKGKFLEYIKLLAENDNCAFS